MFNSISTFIGAIDFKESKQFYKEIGFKESSLSDKMSYFNINENLGFYLQDYNVEDWINNSMLFLEIENVETYLEKLKSLDLTSKYKNCKLSEIVVNDWGKEFFLHDPSGILWHIGCFY